MEINVIENDVTKENKFENWTNVQYKGNTHRFYLLCVCNKHHPNLDLLIKTCVKNGMKLNVIGLNSSDHWGHGISLIFLKDFIQDKQDNDIVCIIDAYDVLMSGSIQDIVSAFESYNCDMLFSGERELAINQRFQHFYQVLRRERPCDNVGPYPHLCSGAYVGFVSIMKDNLMYRAYDEKTDDQHFWISCLSDTSNTKRMEIDSHARLAANLGCSRQDYDCQKSSKRFVNKLTLAKPAILHFEGGSEVKRLVPIVFDWLINQ